MGYREMYLVFDFVGVIVEEIYILFGDVEGIWN